MGYHIYNRLQLLLQVSKPYDKFFSDEHLKSMEIEGLMPEGQAAPPDDTEMNVPLDANVADADQVPIDDNDYGDGDAEGFDGGDD